MFIVLRIINCFIIKDFKYPAKNFYCWLSKFLIKIMNLHHIWSKSEKFQLHPLNSIKINRLWNEI